MKKLSYIITGMRCQACASSVNKKVESFKSIKAHSLNTLSGVLIVDVDDDFNEQELIVGINSLGFQIQPKSDSSFKMNVDKYYKWWDLVILLIFGTLISYFSMANMLGMGPAMEANNPGLIPVPDAVNIMTNPINFGILVSVLSIPVIIIGLRFYVPGLKFLFKLNPNMDSLISVASITAFIYSYVNFFIMIANQNLEPQVLAHQYGMNLLFEAGSMVITLVYLGKYFEQLVKNRARTSVNDLINIIPTDTQKKQEDGTFKKVCVNAVTLGDILLVKRGERIPVDGIVVEGKAEIDNSAITGESKTINIEPGKEVLAGAILLEGTVQIEAKKVSSDATINNILALVSKSQFSKSKTTQIVDKISLYFVPVIFGVAIIVLCAWLGIAYGNPTILTPEVTPQAAVQNFINVIVIACPCSIGIATPLANVLSSLRGLKNSIVFKDMDIISKFKTIDTFIFDKTGTLTTGEFDIEISELVDETKTPVQIFEIACALEQNQNHPIAESFIKKGKELGVKPVTCTDMKLYESLGLGGTINNKKYYIGSKKLLKQLGLGSFFIELGTTLYLVEESTIIAKFILNDKIQDGAEELVKFLKSQNIATMMLTGDNESSAKKISEKLGLDFYYSGLLPNEKYDVITELKSEGKKIMYMGDGINDAPSLALSDISISPYKSSDIANDSSDIYLLTQDLRAVIAAIKLSKYTQNIIITNIVWAFLYNIIAVIIASGIFSGLGVVLEPWMSAASMTASSACVILTSCTIFLKKLK